MVHMMPYRAVEVPAMQFDGTLESYLEINTVMAKGMGDDCQLAFNSTSGMRLITVDGFQIVPMHGWVVRTGPMSLLALSDRQFHEMFETDPDGSEMIDSEKD